MTVIAVQMDPLKGLNPKSDTSLALAAEAAARGHEVFTYQPHELSWISGEVFAPLRRLDHAALTDGKPAEGAPARRALSDVDAVLIRQDPPYDMAYHANTFLLEAAARRTLVLNDPRAIRNVQEKLSALSFAHLMPATYVGRDVDEIHAFAERFGEVVLKPVSLFGGEGVTRAKAGTDDLAAKAATLLDKGVEPILAQEFLPKVATTDKRVMFLEGDVVGAVGRIPPHGGFIANIHSGGRAVLSELTPREREVCAEVGAQLKAWDVFFAGIDLIDERLSEINVTSPTLVMELRGVGGPDVAKLFWDAADARLAARP